jgi:hypothetical protein
MKEKHISVDDKLHERFKRLAEKYKRSMRGQLDHMVTEEEKKDKK